MYIYTCICCIVYINSIYVLVCVCISQVKLNSKLIKNNTIYYKYAIHVYSYILVYYTVYIYIYISYVTYIT